ncbi:MAG TPA: hypothetical protein VF759_11365 [Allosphingosinicella sp.]|jgi:hypothetical protein
MDLVRVAAAAALALATAVPAASAGAAATGGASDPDRQICKSKPVLGSRLKRVRECHSALERASPSCRPIGSRDTPW